MNTPYAATATGTTDTPLRAGAPAAAILRALRHAAWGELAGPTHRAQRAVLAVLVDSLPRHSSEGSITQAQIADRAGYSLRWVREALIRLERAGIITWRRGGIPAGTHDLIPSRIRVVKTALLALLAAARARHAGILTTRRETTLARLAGARKLTPPGRAGQRHHRRSAHAEVTSALRPLSGGDSVSPPPEPVDNPPVGARPGGLMAAYLAAAGRDQRTTPRRRRPTWQKWTR